VADSDRPMKHRVLGLLEKLLLVLHAFRSLYTIGLFGQRGRLVLLLGVSCLLRELYLLE